MRSSATPKSDRHDEVLQSKSQAVPSCCHHRSAPEDNRQTGLPRPEVQGTTLRSSAAPEGDRHLAHGLADKIVVHVLRSSVASEGARHARLCRAEGVGPVVAILGRPRGRPPPGWVATQYLAVHMVAILGRPGRTTATSHECTRCDGMAKVAILGHPGGRPPRSLTSVAPGGDRHAALDEASLDQFLLRSSVVPGGDRHVEQCGLFPAGQPGCDPRSPRGATATVVEVGDPAHGLGIAILGRPGGDRHGEDDPTMSRSHCTLRSSVAPGGDRHVLHHGLGLFGFRVAILSRPGGDRHTRCSFVTRSRPRGCDPRSPQGATATAKCCSPKAKLFLHVAILDRHGGRPPDRTSSPGRTGHNIAIPGRPGGRPPPSPPISGRRLVDSLQSSVAPGNDRHVS